MTNLTPEEREAMRKIGSIGGQSKSDAKKKSSQANIKKAREARWPKPVKKSSISTTEGVL